MEENIYTPDDIKQKVIDQIKQVFDPEIPVNVFDMGLIYDVNVFPVNNVHILMTLTTPSCPSAQAIPNEIEAKVRELEGLNDVHVEITFDPPYTTDMMSEVAKLELGFM